MIFDALPVKDLSCDLLVGSEVCYSESIAADLTRLIERAASAKVGEVLFADPGRTIRTVSLPNEVSFEDCRVPAENLIGEEGQGLYLCFDLLTKARFPYSAANLGVAVAAHRMAIAHAKQRETFGELLSQRQAIQWMLADAEVEMRATRWLIWDGAWKADRALPDDRMIVDQGYSFFCAGRLHGTNRYSIASILLLQCHTKLSGLPA